MSKFHINKHGVPAPCHAKEGNCPLGGSSGSENHFNNLEDAQKAADAINSQEFGILGGVQPREKLNIDLSGIDASTKDGKNELITKAGILMTRDTLIQNNLGSRGIDNDVENGFLQWEDYGEDSFAWYQDVMAAYPLSENERISENQAEVFREAGNVIEHLQEQAQLSDDPEEIIANTERSLANEFIAYNFSEKNKKELTEKHGGYVGQSNVDAAAKFLEYAMTNPKSYRYLDPEVHPADRQEFIDNFSRATGHPREPLNHWATQRALMAAQDHYRSPLNSSFSGGERRAKEAAQALRDWLKDDVEEDDDYELI